MSNNLYLIDGHAVAYKYYFAYQKDPLVNSRNDIMSSMFGLAKLLTTLFKYFPVTHIGVIFDSPYRTWRKELYPEYKANRKKVDDIKYLLEKCYIMCSTWGIYTSAFKGLEADDVIGILAKQAEKEGFNTYIVTKDKDYCQIISESVKLFDLGETINKDQTLIIDRPECLKRHGVEPYQIPEYLALMGDTSDNIPGVEGVGKKAACTLLQKYANIEGIYNNINDLTPKMKINFEVAKETIKRDLMLTTFKYIDLGINLNELKVPSPIASEPILRLLEEEFEFHSIVKELCS